jgi:hypothetical protein
MSEDTDSDSELEDDFEKVIIGNAFIVPPLLYGT